jgi:hypothetical protein
MIQASCPMNETKDGVSNVKQLTKNIGDDVGYEKLTMRLVVWTFSTSTQVRRADV